MHGRNHSREFKLEVCRQVDQGEKRPAQICREHLLANSLLAKWRQEYRSRGENAFSGPASPSESEALQVRIVELERLCGQLALENAVLKKAIQRPVYGNGTR